MIIVIGQDGKDLSGQNRCVLNFCLSLKCFLGPKTSFLSKHSMWLARI